MSIKLCQEEVQGHQQEIARLQQEKSREAAEAANLIKSARHLARMADPSGMGIQHGHTQYLMRESKHYQECADRCQPKIADLEAKIAREQELLYEAQTRLLAAQDQESRSRDQAQKRVTRSHGQRMKALSGKLEHHDQLHTLALSAIERLQHLPEEIVVLFFAANPFNQQELRLDEEVRAIGEMIRKSKHRDSVRLESRWAVRPLDVLQAINECRPRIGHFSGHGSDRDEIVFQDNAGQAKLVSKEAIAQTMAAASGDIQLAFFNTGRRRQLSCWKEYQRARLPSCSSRLGSTSMI